ncbi:hypothetical protein XA68_16512 [Ophiocordyceps unilateralis]|uniref:Uncharacterized protein n=1 Tax=Ophiocordyceps unilateralis TaxID=268505 RepID=A0A2A9PLE5_OPHUN|nr:hypothetical protein XA68_16512 [Ophiocordyceps unilateralis]
MYPLASNTPCGFTTRDSDGRGDAARRSSVRPLTCTFRGSPYDTQRRFGLSRGGGPLPYHEHSHVSTRIPPKGMAQQQPSNGAPATGT